MSTPQPQGTVAVGFQFMAFTDEKAADDTINAMALRTMRFTPWSSFCN